MLKKRALESALLSCTNAELACLGDVFRLCLEISWTSLPKLSSAFVRAGHDNPCRALRIIVVQDLAIHPILWAMFAQSTSAFFQADVTANSV